MKKCFFGAIAVLALASCSNEKVVELSQDQEIKFTVEAGKATSRAHDGYCNNVKPGDFQVWASAQGKNYFNALGEKYTLQDGVYKPENGTLRYWPESGTVNFFATKNENGTSTWAFTNPSSLKFTGYTVQATPAAQLDFIYAAKLNVEKTSSAVELNFRHALSQIEFKAQNNNNKIYVEIDEVSVVNVNSKGNITITKDTSTKFQDHNLGDAADDNDTRGDNRCEWSDQSVPATYTASFTAVPVGSSATSLTVTDASGEYNTNTMYLLPQTLTAWDKTKPAKHQDAENTGSYFLVKALIYNVAGESVDKTNDVVVWGTAPSGEKTSWTTKEIAIPVPASTTWEDGKRYVYTFVFTKTGNGGYDPDNNKPVLTPITLQVDVDDFVDTKNKDVEMK